MNIIMAVIGLVGLKRAPECIKMHHFEGENAKNIPSPDPTPVDAFDVVDAFGASALDPRPHFWIRAWVLYNFASAK